eukprot:3241771-Prymnesium_polylepis.1
MLLCSPGLSRDFQWGRAAVPNATARPWGSGPWAGGSDPPAWGSDRARPWGSGPWAWASDPVRPSVPSVGGWPPWGSGRVRGARAAASTKAPS